MASTTSVPVEQSQVRPSFAKVAASSYKPQSNQEAPPIARSTAMKSPPIVHSDSARRAMSGDSERPEVRLDNVTEQAAKDHTSSAATGHESWAKSAAQQVVLQPSSRDEESEKPRPSITLVKSLATEDNTTQLSSSDGSGKPPSLDGKSVASATTFALDEKESIRPDDSASLRAVEEEDITSPPDSVANDSRVGSDSGIARAFRDQLHEIAVIGPRGVPPGRFPSVNPNNPQVLYDPNQPPNGMGRPLSQPLGSGPSPPMTLPHNLPAIPDEKLIEALESPRDRLFVLKLEQDFIDFIKDSRETELSLPNCNTFYRMLAHRLADYYLLGHVVDTTMTGVKITRTHYCRIPPPLSGLPVSSKNANTPPVDLPARKIMRRGDDTKSGTNTTANSEGPSKTTSEVGGGSGSDGGNDANDSENKEKSAMTREEREARYREARQRIFGNSENEENEATENIRPEEKDASRSSSTSGKKKSKKQRNYDDDFEARSRFNAYYPQPYHPPNFAGDQTVYYGGFPGQMGQMHNQQFGGMNANVSPPPPPSYNSGYPVMMPQDSQGQYGWPGPQFQPPNGAVGYPNYGSAQNGYDLTTDFQRGMQSFQSAMPSQVTPKMANAPMASYQDTYQPQPLPMNPQWSQVSPQPSYNMGQPSYPPNGPANRPMSAPVQGPVPGQYSYGQLPPNTYNGKAPRNPHPVPGSFNRQHLNPQILPFIPGGRNAPYQMQTNAAPMPQGMNGYGNFAIPPNQLSNQLPGPSPPGNHQQTFGSPRSMQNIVPAKPSGSGSSQAPQMPTPQVVPIHLAVSQPNSSPVPAQSSIAKWGTPSHLPPKPPPPAQPQPPKFNLPGHNNFSSPVPRAPNNMTQGYAVNSPILRGVGPGLSNNPPT